VKTKLVTRFGTWNVRSLYRPGSLMAVSRELARYKLDLVGVQEWGFLIWRRPSIFMDVAMREHCTFDCEVFRCGKVY
jgi:hypothetical protein